LASKNKLVSLYNLKRFLDYLRTGFTAPKSKCDALGNVIDTTYLQKKDVMGDESSDSSSGGKFLRVGDDGVLNVGQEIDLHIDIEGVDKATTKTKTIKLKFDGDCLVSDVPIKAEIYNTAEPTRKDISVADEAKSVHWKNIKDKPDGYPPLMHTHDDYVKKSELSMKEGDVTLDVLGIRVQNTMIVPTTDSGVGNFWIS